MKSDVNGKSSCTRPHLSGFFFFAIIIAMACFHAGQLYAAVSCDNWLTGQCVAHARSMAKNASGRSLPSCGTAINCPTNKDMQDVTEGDIVKLNIGSYGHVAYVLSRDGNSLKISEKNKGGKLTRETFRRHASRNGTPDTDENFSYVKSECGVTEKYDVEETRTIDLSQVVGVWSPNPGSKYPSSVAQPVQSDNKKIQGDEPKKQQCSKKDKEKCQDKCEDKCDGKKGAHKQCYQDCKEACYEKKGC